VLSRLDLLPKTSLGLRTHLFAVFDGATPDAHPAQPPRPAAARHPG